MTDATGAEAIRGHDAATYQDHLTWSAGGVSRAGEAPAPAPAPASARQMDCASSLGL